MYLYCPTSGRVLLSCEHPWVITEQLERWSDGSDRHLYIAQTKKFPAGVDIAVAVVTNPSVHDAQFHSLLYLLDFLIPTTVVNMEGDSKPQSKSRFWTSESKGAYTQLTSSPFSTARFQMRGSMWSAEFARWSDHVKATSHIGFQCGDTKLLHPKKKKLNE